MCRLGAAVVVEMVKVCWISGRFLRVHGGFRELSEVSGMLHKFQGGC